MLISKLQTAKTVREVNKPGQGAIIFNVSSAGGFNANPGLAFYASSKFGESRVWTSLGDCYLKSFHTYSSGGLY